MPVLVLRYFSISGLHLIAACLLLVQGCANDSWDSAAPQTTVAGGKLRGALVDGVRVFKGIPYAAPPVANLRWMPPQPAAAWNGVRAATEYGPHCAQIDPGILWFELDEFSEDCLNLNVWTPANHPLTGKHRTVQTSDIA